MLTRQTNPAERVRALRRRLGVDQEEFARRFGLRARTIQEWEQGRAVPEGPARTLLDVIEREALAVRRALIVEDERYPETLANVRDLVLARVPEARWTERQHGYPAIWRGDRLVTIGLGFWPGRLRSCILVSAAEHRWFDIAVSAIPIAQYVVDGLLGPVDAPEMTFERFVDIADYAMRSVVDGRVQVELQTDRTGVALWRSDHAEVRLTLFGASRLRVVASPANEEFRDDWYLWNGEATQFGATDLAEAFLPSQRRSSIATGRR